MIEFISITSDPAYARRLWSIPGNTVMVDLERTGKRERQAGRNTVISTHSMDDVSALAQTPGRGELLVRIDPVRAGGLTQLPLLCELGVDRIMLPMFEDRKSVDETVLALEQWSAGRVKLSLLAETHTALEQIREILRNQPDWLDHVHIGLNDLSLERGSRFLFEPVATGEIAILAALVLQAGRRFGFGGVGLPRRGGASVPAEAILGEHVRVGSSAVILSRSFHSGLDVDGPMSLEAGISSLRSWEGRWSSASFEELEENHARLRDSIMAVAGGNPAIPRDGVGEEPQRRRRGLVPPPDRTSLPSELILLSPRPERDEAFHELASRLVPIVAPLSIRVFRGDGPGDPPPRPGAGLIAGGQPGTRTLLDALGVGDTGSPRDRSAGWSWVHLTSSGPDPFEGWGPIPGDPLRTYSRGVNARSLAEWVLGAILHFQRDFGRHAETFRTGGWERHVPREIEGRTMLVLGAGSGGSEAARAGAALGLRSIGVSRSGMALAGFDRVLPVSALNQAWGMGDITVVLLPLTPETRGSVGADEIARLRPGSLLLVVSRGGIVDEEAVLAAVRSGHLAGAAFDVFAREPLPPDSPLRGDPRILLTPHVAGSSDRFMERTAAVLEKIWRSAFLGDEPDRLAFYRYET